MHKVKRNKRTLVSDDVMLYVCLLCTEEGVYTRRGDLPVIKYDTTPIPIIPINEVDIRLPQEQKDVEAIYGETRARGARHVHPVTTDMFK